MLSTTHKNVSPSRTYVALCNNGNFDGHYFIKFTLPETVDQVPEYFQQFAGCHDIRNDSEYACWYFLNVLDSVACIDGCLVFEDYSNLRDQVDIDARRAEQAVEWEKEFGTREIRCA